MADAQAIPLKSEADSFVVLQHDWWAERLYNRFRKWWSNVFPRQFRVITTDRQHHMQIRHWGKWYDWVSEHDDTLIMFYEAEGAVESMQTTGWRRRWKVVKRKAHE